MSLGLGITGDGLLYDMERSIALDSVVTLPALLGALFAGLGVLVLGWLVRRRLKRVQG